MSDQIPEKIVKSKNAEREEEILAFWNKERIFQKSLEKESPRGDFVFYDGPPFATGLPHFGHMVPNTVKDAIPRYKTMQGYHVPRRWGWDCHGLPVENLVEKELGLSSKKDILTYGMEKFNAAAKKSVKQYAHEWERVIPRIGRWVDMENDYETMDPYYTESVWNVFKKLHEKGLIYEGFKSMQLCPHCETTLSNFEVNQGYKDITDISVYVKFAVKDEANTYFVAWTTTPWTLPGNVALAVGKDIEYTKIKIADSFYYIAKERLSAVKEEYSIVETVKGASLVGKAYTPVFPYYAEDAKLAGHQNGWKVYAADFVTTESGTGIVHIAPAFGEDDMNLGKENDLPFVQHVETSGAFKPEVTAFAGQKVKPKEDHQKGDVEVIKYLAGQGTLFAKEKIIHSYPHCWRCETPLLNYASSSWFVKVTALREKLVAENKKITWVPEEIGSGRFGKWLEGARDWSISRSRFWGAPLPVWRAKETGEIAVIGSISDLRERLTPRNNYFVMRHGESEHNVKGVVNSDPQKPFHLTEKGKEQAKKGATTLKGEKIDMVFVSPFPRTKETAEIVVAELGLKQEQLVADDRIREINTGKLEGSPVAEYHAFFHTGEDRFKKAPEGGECYDQVRKRMGDFIHDIDSKYEGKNILIVTHDSPGWLLFSAAQYLTNEETRELRGTSDYFFENASVKPLRFVALPRDEKGKVELHRPFIDDITFASPTGAKMQRVQDVFDCWFESGAMPYGSAHYPFENKEVFDPESGIFKKAKGYPADFISEGLDQTRGWFYTMLVLGVALFGKAPYKRVISNGLVLAEDGQKMSKKKKNYPDPMLVIDRYGVDALRWYLLSSPIVRAQDLRFSEKGVDEVVKKHIGRLQNVYSFYALYATPNDEKGDVAVSAHVLDRWIVARLGQVRAEVTKGMESYELDRAVRPFADFIDDLSTWYLRRSRDRFKGDDQTDKAMALATIRNVLEKLSQLLAPFTPFLAEDLYQKIVKKGSVHLTSWPAEKELPFGSTQEKEIAKMTVVREFVTKALEERSKANIKVRQPLSRLALKIAELLPDEHLALIKDEVNVKSVVQEKSTDNSVFLETVLNESLISEGIARDVIRTLQEMRKEKGLQVADEISLFVDTSEKGKAILTTFEKDIKKVAGVKEIIFEPAEGVIPTVIENISFSLSIRKV